MMGSPKWTNFVCFCLVNEADHMVNLSLLELGWQSKAVVQSE